jgi:hypothetical protein
VRGQLPERARLPQRLFRGLSQPSTALAVVWTDFVLLSLPNSKMQLVNVLFLANGQRFLASALLQSQKYVRM